MTDGISVSTAARWLGCHRQNIHNLIRRGKLRVVAWARWPHGMRRMLDPQQVTRLRRNGYGGMS